MTLLFNGLFEHAILIAEPRVPNHDSEVQIISVGSIEDTFLSHSNYWRLYWEDNLVLNVYLESEFRDARRDWRWMTRQESLKYEHLYEALKQPVVKEHELFGITL